MIFLHAQNLTIYNDYIKEKNTKILYPLPPNTGGDYAEKGGEQDKYLFQKLFTHTAVSKVGAAAYVSTLTFITQMEHSSERGEAICQRNQGFCVAASQKGTC